MTAATWDHGGGIGGDDSDEPCLRAHEFIAIGSVRRPISDFNRQLIVLQLEWKEDIAQRTNIGRVAEDAWLAADHRWKLIVLG